MSEPYWMIWLTTSLLPLLIAVLFVLLVLVPMAVRLIIRRAKNND